MTIRVQMPDINTAERWKRGRIETVKTQKAADELIAQGGWIVPSEPEPEPDEKPAKGSR